MTVGTQPVVRVVLVDDHHLVRAGLAGLLGGAADLEVVGQAADGRQAVDLARRTTPDVVLMDLSMPVLDGVGATREILAERPVTRIVVLTSFADHERVREALVAGAVGYLLKDCEPAELLAAVRSAARGQAPLDPRVAVALLPAAAAAQPAPGAAGAPATLGDVAVPAPAVEGMSRREREVLALIGEGMANKQIARRLGITERTVKAHVGSLFRRIGVADRTSAALWARDHPQEARLDG